MSRPTILVTGGAGYIGSHAVLALLDAGYPVIVLDTLVTGFDWAVDPRALLIVGDIADSALVAEVLRAHDIRAIIHFAGSILVAESVTDPLKYYRNNTAASANLIDTALGAGVRHLLFSSTAATYGQPPVSPIPETAPTVPINPYGRSKLMTEQMLADVARAHPLNYCALRYFNVAGADPQGRSGQSSAVATHLIKIAAEAAIGLRDRISVFGSDYPTADGTCVRDYIHVSDLAAAHLHALERLMAVPDENMVLNCGYGRGFSVLEVLDAVDRVTGRAIARVIAERRPGDPPELVADNRAILATLPWRPAHDDLEAIIADAIAWEERLAARRAGRAAA